MFLYWPLLLLMRCGKTSAAGLIVSPVEHSGDFSSSGRRKHSNLCCRWDHVATNVQAQTSLASLPPPVSLLSPVSLAKAYPSGKGHAPEFIA